MTSFNPAAPASTPAAPANVTPASSDSQPTGFEFEYGGRKFTREELLTKLTHADSHIATLTQERASDRELLTQATQQLQAAVKAAELLKATPATPATPAVPAATAVPDITSVVDQVVSARETKAREEANWKAAQDAMTKAYGDQADVKAREAAASLGMTFEDMVVMARRQPLAFAKVFNFGATPVVSGQPAAGGVNTQAVKAEGKKTSGYWDAKSNRDQTAIYLNRLKELSGA